MEIAIDVMQKVCHFRIYETCHRGRTECADLQLEENFRVETVLAET